MTTPRCSACREKCQDVARRFDPVLRWVCPECHGFLLYSEKVLRKAGIEGVMYNKPENEKP